MTATEGKDNAKARRPAIIPPAPILWRERQAFLDATVRIEGLKLWSSLRDLLAVFQSTRSLKKAVWRGHVSPTEMDPAVAIWAEMNGYRDAWMKNVGLYQLYMWSHEHELGFEPSLDSIAVPPFTGLDGLPPPFCLEIQPEWRPQHGETWDSYAKSIRSVVKDALKIYKEKCLWIYPQLTHLRGYEAYEDLAEYQAGLHKAPLDEATLKRIKRTAHRLGITLRGHRS